MQLPAVSRLVKDPRDPKMVWQSFFHQRTDRYDPYEELIGSVDGFVITETQHENNHWQGQFLVLEPGQSLALDPDAGHEAMVLGPHVKVRLGMDRRDVMLFEGNLVSFESLGCVVLSSHAPAIRFQADKLTKLFPELVNLYLHRASLKAQGVSVLDLIDMELASLRLVK